MNGINLEVFRPKPAVQKNKFEIFTCKFAKIHFSNGIVSEREKNTALRVRKAVNSMELSSSQRKTIRHQFDSFCKKVLREEYRDCVRETQRRLQHEISFSELSLQEMDQLYVMDEYSTDSHHRPITVEEADKLIQCISILPNLKSKLEVLIPLLTGSRGSEIILIQPQNFDFTTNKLHLTLTKNGLPRDIPIPYFLIPIIQAYLKTYDFRTGEYIFPGQGSKHETVRTPRDHIEKCVQLSGIKRKVTPHDLRATYATYQSYYGGLHIKALQKYLGHESYETSMKYVADEFETSDCKINLKDLYAKWAEMLKSSYGDGTIFL